MQTIYRILADIVVTVHFAYVTFVAVGLFVTLLGGVLRWQWVRNPWFRFIHLAMIVIVVFEAWMGLTCPLTIWEHQLRTLSQQATYRGGFLPNLLHNAMFFDAEPWVFTMGYTVFGLAVLLAFILVPPRVRHTL